MILDAVSDPVADDELVAEVDEKLRREPMDAPKFPGTLAVAAWPIVPMERTPEPRRVTESDKFLPYVPKP